VVRHRVRSSAFSLLTSHSSLKHHPLAYSTSDDARSILDDQRNRFISARDSYPGDLEGLSFGEMDHSAADLCSRCASIPWDHLEQKKGAWFWRDEKPTLGDLQTSSCRLCRLITSAILTRLVQNAHLQSVVKMCWKRTPEFVNDCLGSMSIWTNSGDSGNQFAGELILTTGDVTAWSTAASKRVDFAKVRPGLEACKASHKSCEPAKSLQLHNLRVIDCIREAVVMAPTA